MKLWVGLLIVIVVFVGLSLIAQSKNLTIRELIHL